MTTAKTEQQKKALETSQTVEAQQTAANAKIVNPKHIFIDDEKIDLDAFLQEYNKLKKNTATKKQEHTKIIKKRRQESRLKPYQAELIRMQQYLEEAQQSMVIVFEGRDAAGKSGAIRRVTRYMNEKRYRVVALGKPTREQQSQWYFQKYVSHFPRGGEVVLFDRSWYNRATVEQVFGFCSQEDYQNFMQGVVGFEKDLVRQGTILVKLYFSVTKKEQARRFKQRENDPLRQWKFNEVDWEAQEQWDDFTEQKYRILKYTSTHEATWTVIRSDNKAKARLNAMKVILNSVPYQRTDTQLDYVPDPEIAISAARELELMEAQRISEGKFIH